MNLLFFEKKLVDSIHVRESIDVFLKNFKLLNLPEIAKFCQNVVLRLNYLICNHLR